MGNTRKVPGHMVLTRVFRRHKHGGCGMSRLRLGAVLVLGYMVCTVNGLGAQQPVATRVGIAAFESADDPRLQAAAESITTTIGLTLHLLDGYEVQQTGPWAYTGGGAPQAADLRGLDFIVFGSVQDRAGSIDLDLAVYSRAENSVTTRHQDSVHSVFDLFDASDEAATVLLESLSGEVIRFATLRLQNVGSPGEYAVFVDDVPVGRNLSELRVLVGNRSVRISQERMFSEYTVYEGVETLQVGGVRTVEFRIPLTTAEERRSLVELEQRILHDWDNPERSAVVEQLFARALLLLDEISYSPELAGYRTSFLELREEYAGQLAAAPESGQPLPTAEEDAPLAGVLVQGRRFIMGIDPQGDAGDEGTDVQVDSFYIMPSPVVFDEYDEFAGSTDRPMPDDAGWGRGTRPVIHVSWFEALLYANYRSLEDGLEPAYKIRNAGLGRPVWAEQILVTGSRERDRPGVELFPERLQVDWDPAANGWRLPTEVEWEFAARGGHRSRLTRYAGSDFIRNVGWYRDTAPEGTQPVTAKQPNELGIYDMSGNVWEWVWDTAANDPGRRVIRGGSHASAEAELRVNHSDSALASLRSDEIGFRLVRNAEGSR